MKPRSVPNPRESVAGDVRTRATAAPAVRVLSALLAVVGVVVTLGSLFSDQLGLFGPEFGVGLGWKQLIGAIVGLVLLLLGAGWLIQPPFQRR